MKQNNLAKAIVIAEKGLSFDIVRQSHLFPPRDILNSFLQCGIDDAASEISIEWEPFSLNSCEYDQFYDFCKQWGQLKVDRLASGDFTEWFSKAATKT